jgi:hypothetical protein
MSDILTKQATQEFAIRGVLINHCGNGRDQLSPDLIDQLMTGIVFEMRD